jgi:hypothetical protein
LAGVRGVLVQKADPWTTGAVVLAAGFTGILVAGALQGSSQPRRTTSTGAEGIQIGSCPLVYSWDGNDWRLDSGTFSGALTEGAARTEVDNLLYAVPHEGTLRLKLANEMPETDYVDALTVLAVDHRPGTQIVPDAFGGLHTVSQLRAPVRARDFRDRDAMERIAASDGWHWESALSDRDSARVEDVRDGLQLTFTRPPGAVAATLVLDATNTPWAGHLKSEYIMAHGAATAAWYDSLDADVTMVTRLAENMIREAYLVASVWTGESWLSQGHYWEAGSEVGKRHAVRLDLSLVVGDTVRVRLESAPAFWLIDYAAIDYSDPQPFSRHEVEASRVVAAGGERIRSRLAAVDREYVVLDAGDYYELEFRVPDVPPGTARSYLLESSGWYRVHTDQTQPAQIALLRQADTERYGISKISVARLNQVLNGINAR